MGRVWSSCASVPSGRGLTRGRDIGAKVNPRGARKEPTASAEGRLSTDLAKDELVKLAEPSAFMQRCRKGEASQSLGRDGRQS